MRKSQGGNLRRVKRHFASLLLLGALPLGSSERPLSLYKHFDVGCRHVQHVARYVVGNLYGLFALAVAPQFVTQGWGTALKHSCKGIEKIRRRYGQQPICNTEPL